MADIDQDPPELDAVSQGHTLSDSTAQMAPLNPSTVAEAFERRLKEQRERELELAQEKAKAYVAFDEDHEKRQAFRRMIDPGILRPNARPLALESLRTLLTLAENIIKNPDDPKFQKFKPTNARIKQLLIDPKGTLEYARAMGFNPEVENFQPFYVFNKKKHMGDLRIGAEILKEALDRELTKEEREERAKREEKAIKASEVANIKQAFLDDRKSRLLQERREKEVREARSAAAARRAAQPQTPPTPSTPRTMPGSGHTLSGRTVQADDAADEDDDDGEY